MPRARNIRNRGYPKSWRFRYDAYYYRVPKGQEHLWDGKKEFHLGRSLNRRMGKARPSHRARCNGRRPTHSLQTGCHSEEGRRDSAR